MDIKVRVLTAEESWKHQLSIYRMYHAKYKEDKNKYPPESFFKHPYLLEKFSNPDLSESELKEVETYFKNNIYNGKNLERYKDAVEKSVVPFIAEKSEILEQLPVKHPSELTIVLSGAASNAFYDADADQITLCPQTLCHPDKVAELLPQVAMHEFTHICVEDDVQKHKLPHTAKERLVSRICSELLDFDDNNYVQDKRLDKAITKDKLMSDYHSVLANLKKQVDFMAFMQRKGGRSK